MDEEPYPYQPKDYTVLLQGVVVLIFLLGMLHAAMQHQQDATPVPTPAIVATPSGGEK